MAHRELEELFERYREHHDLAALGLVFDRTAGELLAIARRLARDEAAAEDLVQATFAAAIEHADRFDRKRELVPWLAGILANKAKLAQWARSREPDAARLAERAEIDPAVDAELREFVVALDRALQRLPRKYADVLRRALADGERPERIARELGLEPGTVRVRLHRGLAALRKLLPIGFALGAGVSLSPRGLSAVRASVLRHAKGALTAGATASASLLGTWNAAVATAAVGLLAGAGIWAMRSANREPVGVSAQVAEIRNDWAARSSNDALALSSIVSEDARKIAATKADEGKLESADVSSATADLAAGMTRLSGKFQGPDGILLQPQRARVVLRGELGARYELETRASADVRFEGIAPDRYALDVDAQGFLHLEQTFDLSTALDGRANDSEQPSRLILWPDGWIPVIARTRDGRPFRELAGELGMEPVRLFVGALEASVRLDAPTSDARDARDERLATFHRPPNYQQWELPGGTLGSLHLLHAPPLWVGLRLWDDTLGWEYLSGGARQIVFTLDADAFERRFARLTLQVVDGPTGRPAADARVTLRADTSARRRKDQQDVAPASDGTVEFARVVPGKYELSIERGDALVQQRLVLALGERRDLGRVEVESGARIPVRVQDPAGNPVEAWIEIGPYHPGANVNELYPPMLHRHTRGAGNFPMPMPMDVSIVRATVTDRKSRDSSAMHSPDVVVDPRSPPRELVLVVCEPIEVRCEVGDAEAVAYELVDERDLVVAHLPVSSGSQPLVDVVPGDYRARLLGADGKVRAETTVAAKDVAVRLSLP